MKPRSAKNKGKRLQNEVRDLLLETFDTLEPDDVESTGMGQPGIDVKLSPAARKVFPYSIECKNQERGNIWAWWKQAVSNCKETTSPLLIHSKNHAEVLVTMRLTDFLKVAKNKT